MFIDLLFANDQLELSFLLRAIQVFHLQPLGKQPLNLKYIKS